jgi:hypothetical protein
MLFCSETAVSGIRSDKMVEVLYDFIFKRSQNKIKNKKIEQSIHVNAPFLLTYLSESFGPHKNPNISTVSNFHKEKISTLLE